jgi:hypothetical protein
MLAEMRATRRILAVLECALAVREPDRCGVAMAYRASLRRKADLPILDFADLRPGGDVGSALGLARLLRLLREARLSAAGEWLGEPEAAARRLAGAIGTEFRLEVVPRSRMHFEAWTEDGAIAVATSPRSRNESAFFVAARRTHPPVRLERAGGGAIPRSNVGRSPVVARPA